MKKRGRIIDRVWREARYPLLIGIAWGVISLLIGRPYFESASAGGAAFFFCLFAQGQVLRIAKNVRDEENASSVSSSLADLKADIGRLLKSQVEPPVSVTARRVHTSSEGLIAQARVAIADKRYADALRLAGNAFEQAIRSAAQKKKVPIDSDVISGLAAYFENKEIVFLNQLANIQGSMKHVAGYHLSLSKSDAQALVDKLDAGIRIIEERMQKATAR